MAIKLIPTKEIQSERIYANFFTVNHGPYDFTLTFCDAQPPQSHEAISRATSEETLEAPVQVEIAVPVPLLPQIIQALQTNYDAYRKAYIKDEEEQRKSN